MRLIKKKASKKIDLVMKMTVTVIMSNNLENTQKKQINCITIFAATFQK